MTSKAWVKMKPSSEWPQDHIRARDTRVQLLGLDPGIIAVEALIVCVPHKSNYTFGDCGLPTFDVLEGRTADGTKVVPPRDYHAVVCGHIAEID